MNQARDSSGLEPTPAGSHALTAMRRQGRRLGQYAMLMRLDRPVSSLLLLWPVLAALWIAGDAHPRGRVFVVFVLGALVMHAAGSVINDFADRDVDPAVRRTRGRPLAARHVGPLEALALSALLLAVALWLVMHLDTLTVRMSVVGAALAVSAPFLKRFFPLPQFHLAIAFSWGVPMAFAAQTGTVPRVAWLLFFAGILWAAAWGTIHAMVDREDDLRIGVKSSAILFADMDRFLIAVMQLAALFALLLVGRTMRFGHWYGFGLIAAAALFAWQQWLIRRREPEACLRAYGSNHYVGLAIFAGLVLEYSLHS